MGVFQIYSIDLSFLFFTFWPNMNALLNIECLSVFFLNLSSLRSRRVRKATMASRPELKT